MLKESPFFSVITILGTALAICMIMVMVIVFEIQNKGFKPELNRDRTLYVRTWRSRIRMRRMAV